MNGLEQILLKIEEDANAEVNKILKEAENESRDFVDKSVQNAEAEAEKLISAAKKKAALIAENAKSGSEAYIKREEVKHFTALVSVDKIIENDCNLSVSSYVEPEDSREKIDIEAVNNSLVDVVKDVNRFMAEVNGIIEEMEG